MGVLYQGPIRLVLFDVDGVLTDGSLHLDGRGERIKTFNARDGLAVSLLRAHGIQSGILSGKSSEALDFRIQQLKFDVSITGRIDKYNAYLSIKREYGLNDSEIAYVGDDIIDLPLAGIVGLFYAPSDAHFLVKESADYVVSARGGRGVAREVAEHLLLAGGLSIKQLYHPLLTQWETYNATQ
ncbi:MULTISPECIES: KdsC family phosphatase [Pectobacterium]|uniref:KdsC family phosphatase n=1 Tax=Pectobacterium TaxID=122277 RepID=UPI000E768E01|nr:MULTISPECIES: HAD-IIIA family hydrolase [Pectobacterium]RJL30199.1 HAD-IIIA family hydrolase [Pectobacterium polaris]